MHRGDIGGPGDDRSCCDECGPRERAQAARSTGRRRARPRDRWRTVVAMQATCHQPVADVVVFCSSTIATGLVAEGSRGVPATVVRLTFGHQVRQLPADRHHVVVGGPSPSRCVAPLVRHGVAGDPDLEARGRRERGQTASGVTRARVRSWEGRRGPHGERWRTPGAQNHEQDRLSPAPWTAPARWRVRLPLLTPDAPGPRQCQGPGGSQVRQGASVSRLIDGIGIVVVTRTVPSASAVTVAVGSSASSRSAARSVSHCSSVGQSWSRSRSRPQTRRCWSARRRRGRGRRRTPPRASARRPRR